jgi:hypothetical protein|eukprot:COSAG02_NODE_48343_length_334_cov_0.880851_1_plen_69_part_00
MNLPDAMGSQYALILVGAPVLTTNRFAEDRADGMESWNAVTDFATVCRLDGPDLRLILRDQTVIRSSQ